MFIDSPAPSAATSAMYENNAKSQGFTMNFTRAWAWRPDIFDGFVALRTQLVAQSTLSKREQAVMVCAMASELGDAYCSLAWGKTLSQEAGPDVAAAVINGDSGSLADRDRALADWARKLVADPNSTSQADIDRLHSTGLSDREIFEATVFIAFRLAFSTVNDALGIAPDWQVAAAAPPQVRASVDYGREPATAPAGSA
jgi:uncharacterized peroxidase-related enzyme